MANRAAQILCTACTCLCIVGVLTGIVYAFVALGAKAPAGIQRVSIQRNLAGAPLGVRDLRFFAVPVSSITQATEPALAALRIASQVYEQGFSKRVEITGAQVAHIYLDTNTVEGTDYASCGSTVSLRMSDGREVVFGISPNNHGKSLYLDLGSGHVVTDGPSLVDTTAGTFFTSEGCIGTLPPVYSPGQATKAPTRQPTERPTRGMRLLMGKRCLEGTLYKSMPFSDSTDFRKCMYDCQAVTCDAITVIPEVATSNEFRGTCDLYTRCLTLRTDLAVRTYVLRPDSEYTFVMDTMVDKGKDKTCPYSYIENMIEKTSYTVLVIGSPDPVEHSTICVSKCLEMSTCKAVKVVKKEVDFHTCWLFMVCDNIIADFYTHPSGEFYVKEYAPE